jgi:hypothetical protein
MAKRKSNSNELKVRKGDAGFELYSGNSGDAVTNAANIKVNRSVGDDHPVATVILKIPLDG